MQILKRLLAVILCFAIVTCAQNRIFDKVRYDGGSISTYGKPDDWEAKLTVSAEAIIVVLKTGESVTIPPKQVIALSYGHEVFRHVKPVNGLVVISVSSRDRFAIHGTTLHYIGISYRDKDGKDQGLVLQRNGSNFRSIIVALQGVTGAPVWVSEKERGEVPTGITTQTAKEPEETKAIPSN